MNPVTVVIGGVGALLIYAAIKGRDPRSIISDALSNKSSKGKVASADTTDTADTTDSSVTGMTPVQRTGN